MKFITMILFLVSILSQSDKLLVEKNINLLSTLNYSEFQTTDGLVKLNLIDNKITVDLPSSFELMTEKMLEAKYPSNNRPTLVYTNKDGTINFAFNHTNNSIPADKLPEVLPVFVQQFNSSYPQIEWIKKNVGKVNKKDFIKLEFITPAMDSKIYNIMYVTVLEGRLLMSSFNCLESQMKDWSKDAKKSLNSIKIK